MIYEIMNRADAREATKEPNAPTTVIVSITDYGDDKNEFYPQPWLKEILELQFDDTEEEVVGFHSISTAHAESIADFVLNTRKSVGRLIVHCEFGQSRSAGVMAAIRTHFEGIDGGIFRSRRYAPNRLCYRLVLEALKKRSKLPQFMRKGKRENGIHT